MLNKDTRRKHLGPKVWKKWSDEEKEFLRKNFETMTDEEIAEKLERNLWSIKNQRSRIGCVRYNRRNRVAIDERKEHLIRMSDITERRTCPKCGKEAHKSESKLACYHCDSNWFTDTVEYESNLEAMPYYQKVKCKSRGTSKSYTVEKLGIKHGVERASWRVIMDTGEMELSFEDFVDMFVIEERITEECLA